MSVPAGRDVVSDVLKIENQFLEALNQDGGESHRVVCIKTRHSRIFSYRNDDDCLEAGGNSLLLSGTCFQHTARYIILTSSLIHIHAQQ